jgi:hypothetical protein
MSVAVITIQLPLCSWTFLHHYRCFTLKHGDPGLFYKGALTDYVRVQGMEVSGYIIG